MRSVFAAFAVLCLAGGMASAAPVSCYWTAPPGFAAATGEELFPDGDPGQPGNVIRALGAAWSMLGTAKIADIPAPGTILLAAIGTGLVGWLARRRIL